MNVYDDLWNHYRRKPFAPFNIVLNDGRRLPITRPLQFAFNETRVVVIDEEDRFTRFTPSDIVEFEELHSVAGA